MDVNRRLTSSIRLINLVNITQEERPDVNAGQYEGLMRRLGEILDRMPPAGDRHAHGTKLTVRDSQELPSKLTDPHQRDAASLALRTVLITLDSWIDGQRENHDALSHRGERAGFECWRSFAVSDFRTMVNDAAHELGLHEFSKSIELTTPREDQVR